MKTFNCTLSKKLQLLLVLPIFLIQSITTSAQPVTNKGTDFWLTIGFDNAGLTTPETFLDIISYEASNVVIQYTTTNSFPAVPINVQEVINLRTNSGQSVKINVVLLSGIHVTATTPVSITGYFTSQQSTEVFQAIPTAVLGKEYYVVDKPGGSPFTPFVTNNTSTRILSTADETTLAIEIKNNDKGTFTYSRIDTTLNKGAYISINGTDVSGSHIVSDKPVAVNTSYEMMPPVNTWGKKFGLAEGIYRFLAAEDGTTVTLNNGDIKTLNSTDYIDISTLGAVAIANKPVLVAKVTTGIAWRSHLSTAIIPPLSQLLNNYIVIFFFRTSTFRNRSNSLNIFIPNAAIGGLTSAGQTFDPSIFKPVGNTGYSVAKISTTTTFGSPALSGVLTAPLPFLVTVSGNSDRDQYAYTPGQLYSNTGSVTKLTFLNVPESVLPGQEHCINVKATTIENLPVPGVLVNFTVRSNSGCEEDKISYGITDNNGIASVCYTRFADSDDGIFAVVDNLGAGTDFIWQNERSYVFYSKPTGDLNNLGNWGSLTDGCGNRPNDFGANNTFFLTNRSSYQLTNDWFLEGKIKVRAKDRLDLQNYSLTTGGFILADGQSENGFLQSTIASSLTIKGQQAGNVRLHFYPSANGQKAQIGSLTLDCPAGNISIQNRIDIFNRLEVKNGTLTNSNISLKSNENNTAVVSPIGGIIDATVTVERFIPARRAWRLIGSPVKGNQTINSAWQEGDQSNMNPSLFEQYDALGYGTVITGNGGGFDAANGAGPSILRYDNPSNKWLPLSNTNNTPVSGGPYMLFVRGNRSVTANSGTPPNNATLRATGKLNSGLQIFNVFAKGFTAIGNPFAAPVDFNAFTRINVPNSFYIWDPKLGGSNGVGGYVLFSYNGNSYDVTPTPISNVSRFIQPGQGFLVNSNGQPGTLTINESAQTNPITNVFRSSNPTKALRVGLLVTEKDNNTATLDEAMASYGNSFSNLVDEMDALKPANFTENIGLVRNEKDLMLERRQTVADRDTLFLKMWNLQKKEYVIRFSPENLSLLPTRYGYLADNYLNTIKPISLAEPVNIKFNADGSAASINERRFMVILSNNILKDAITSVGSFKVLPNPVNGRSIQLQFINQPKGSYNIQLVNSLGQVIYKNQVQHPEGNEIVPIRLKSNLVNGMYQLQISNPVAKFKTSLPVLSNLH